MLTMPANAKYAHKEAEYQTVWCKAHNGEIEYKLIDNTRVDCLTKKYAVEFDFAKKVYESIGQALYYSAMTKKRPAIVLIMENPTAEEKYLQKLKLVAKKHKIKVFTMNTLDYNK